jgi:hypothetical protein
LFYAGHPLLLSLIAHQPLLPFFTSCCLHLTFPSNIIKMPTKSSAGKASGGKDGKPGKSGKSSGREPSGSGQSSIPQPPSPPHPSPLLPRPSFPQEILEMPTDPVERKVIEYLLKKGYNRTEQTLRQESAHLDKDGRPIHNRIEELGNVKYTKGFSLLSNWIEQNLDLYKASCKPRILSCC